MNYHKYYFINDVEFFSEAMTNDKNEHRKSLGFVPPLSSSSIQACWLRLPKQTMLYVVMSGSGALRSCDPDSFTLIWNLVCRLRTKHGQSMHRDVKF